MRLGCQQGRVVNLERESQSGMPRAQELAELRLTSGFYICIVAGYQDPAAAREHVTQKLGGSQALWVDGRFSKGRTPNVQCQNHGEPGPIQRSTV